MDLVTFFPCDSGKASCSLAGPSQPQDTCVPFGLEFENTHLQAFEVVCLLQKEV